MSERRVLAKEADRKFWAEVDEEIARENCRAAAALAAFPKEPRWDDEFRSYSIFERNTEAAW